MLTIAQIAQFAQIGALAAATVATGLVAGLFFAFTCAVMPGLRRTDDATFVSAMRAINAAILNVWFLGVFVGAPVLIAIAAVLQWAGPERSGLLPWIVTALGSYVATVVITAGVNVPLNHALDAGRVRSPSTQSLGATRASSDTRARSATRTNSAADLRRARAGFEGPWGRWHALRTVTSTAAFLALAAASVLQ